MPPKEIPGLSLFLLPKSAVIPPSFSKEEPSARRRATQRLCDQITGTRATCLVRQSLSTVVVVIVSGSEPTMLATVVAVLNVRAEKRCAETEQSERTVVKLSVLLDMQL